MNKTKGCLIANFATVPFFDLCCFIYPKWDSAKNCSAESATTTQSYLILPTIFWTMLHFVCCSLRLLLYVEPGRARFPVNREGEVCSAPLRATDFGTI
ncbi:hypothetical protein CWM85_21360 [Klebsiella michiganensis]|uniref:Uncharacterized protein n=1 Tax=Klebsiella michiganensis TaxID=1134687 RepID=A0A2J4YZE0_9ENTR|nr:hypothetical protein CWM85_21360 [Klebsiella michiganensis]